MIRLTIELQMLGWSVVLGLLQLLIASGIANSQRGLSWNMSPRDETPAPLTGRAGRLDRAARNFLETFAFFAAAVLVTQITGHHNGPTRWGAQLYFWARVVYVPLYAFGITGVRTLAWFVSIVGIVLVLIGLLA